LYSKEKRLAIPFVLFTTVGFIAGAAFNHYISFPYLMVFLSSFNTADLAFMPKLDDVFGLYSKMLLGMGLVFQMPAVVYFLAKMHLVTARFLLKNFKYAILVIFIAAAVITPSGDMMTQTIFAMPMIGLYLLSILIAWTVGPKRLWGAEATID
jgi:sec-independent protein translocase protein TatC